MEGRIMIVQNIQAREPRYGEGKGKVSRWISNARDGNGRC